MDKKILNSTNYLIEEMAIYPSYSNQKDKIDIINLVQSVQIYESIFTNSISCEILIADAVSLVEALPIISGEKLTMYISKHSEIFYNLEFVITKISDYHYKNDVTKIYKLTCTTLENIASIQTKVSRSFRNKKISSMIQSIFTNYIDTSKSINVIEDTKFFRSIIIPNYSPFRSINWLCSQAVSSRYGGSSLLFYETKEGYSVRSLESIYSDDPVATYMVRFSKLTDITPDLFTIYQLSSGSIFDYMKSISSGVYANKICTYDPVRKRFETIDNRAEKTREKMTRLAPYSHLYKENINPESAYIFYPTDSNRQRNSYFASKYPSQQPSYNIETFKPQRIFTLGELDHCIKFFITIPGNFDIKAGDVLNININSTIPDNYNAQDQMYAGNYIISSLKHNMVNDKYTIEAEILKDGINIELFDVTD